MLLELSTWLEYDIGTRIESLRDAYSIKYTTQIP